MDIDKGASAVPSAPQVTEARAERPVPESPAQGRIPFQLRIGVIGHRRIQDTRELRQAVQDAIEHAITESGYRAGTFPATPLGLTVVSALADDADRLVVHEVREKRPESRILCALPVTRDDLDGYFENFVPEDSRDELRGRYQEAWRHFWPRAGLVLRTARGQAQYDDGYRWARRAVIRNSDILIALWDGGPSQEVGDTADLIRRMRARDERFSPSEPAPEPRPGAIGRVRVRVSAWLGVRAEKRPSADLPGPLRIIVPTTPGHQIVVDDGPPWDAAAAVVREQLKKDLENLDELNRMTIKDWEKAAANTVHDLASDADRSWSRLNGLAEWIAQPLTRADQAAMTAHNAFLRDSYLLFGSTAAATIVAATEAIIFPGLWWLAFIEVGFLVGSIFVVMAERRRRDHERWFFYRYLAERLRTAFYQLAVGRIPETEFDIGGTPENTVQNGWIRRAIVGVLAQGNVEQAEVSEPLDTLSSLIRGHWLAGQIAYFRKTAKKQKLNYNIVRSLLYGVLGVTIVAALLHSARIWPIDSAATKVLVMCAIGLPAVAAALSNVQNLREFRRHSDRYARMESALHHYLDEFDHEPHLEDLRHLAVQVGDLLTAETRGWLGVVSARGLEVHG